LADRFIKSISVESYVNFLNKLLGRILVFDIETGEVSLRSDEEIFRLGDEDPLIVNKVFVLDKAIKRKKRLKGLRPDFLIDPDSPLSPVSRLLQPSFTLPPGFPTDPGSPLSLSSRLLKPTLTMSQAAKSDDDSSIISDSATSLSSVSGQTLLSTLRGGSLVEKKTITRTNEELNTKKEEDERSPSGSWSSTRKNGLPPGVAVSAEGVYDDVHGIEWTYIDSAGIDHSKRFQVIFSFQPEAADQMRTLLGEYLLEAPGLAKNPPPDPEGWVYCVPGKNSCCVPMFMTRLVLTILLYARRIVRRRS
jgi:hypothetical protein